MPLDTHLVAITYRIWLRYELFRGELSPIQFQLSEQKLGEFIKAHGNTKQHLSGGVGWVRKPERLVIQN
jgi:hypothetical protein